MTTEEALRREREVCDNLANALEDAVSELASAAGILAVSRDRTRTLTFAKYILDDYKALRAEALEKGE